MSDKPAGPSRPGPVVVTYPPGEVFYRVHRSHRPPAFFDTGPHGRFNPPEPLTRAFGTLYLATTPEGAFLETLGRSRFLSPADIDTRRLTTCSFAHAVRAFDASARANRFHYTADGIDLAADAIASSPTYTRPQQLAGLVHAAGLDGISYHARHDNAHESISLAVFGQPGTHDPTAIFADTTTEPIPTWLVERMGTDFGFELLPDVPLP
jgi:hypothetical protein